MSRGGYGAGTCGKCQRSYLLTRDGKVYVHRHPRTEERCPGSGTDPVKGNELAQLLHRRRAAARDAAELPWQQNTPRARRPGQETR